MLILNPRESLANLDPKCFQQKRLLSIVISIMHTEIAA
jgi:hypothetical protein